jgi:hypothetical protein
MFTLRSSFEVIVSIASRPWCGENVNRAKKKKSDEEAKEQRKGLPQKWFF